VRAGARRGCETPCARRSAGKKACPTGFRSTAPVRGPRVRLARLLRALRPQSHPFQGDGGGCPAGGEAEGEAVAPGRGTWSGYRGHLSESSSRRRNRGPRRRLRALRAPKPPARHDAAAHAARAEPRVAGGSVRAASSEAVHPRVALLHRGGADYAGGPGTAPVAACRRAGQRRVEGVDAGALRQDAPHATGAGACPGAGQRGAPDARGPGAEAAAAALGCGLSSARAGWKPPGGQPEAASSPSSCAWCSLCSGGGHGGRAYVAGRSGPSRSSSSSAPPCR
jgi:hypothetical protein